MNLVISILFVVSALYAGYMGDIESARYRFMMATIILSNAVILSKMDGKK